MPTCIKVITATKQYEESDQSDTRAIYLVALGGVTMNIVSVSSNTVMLSSEIFDT